MGDTSSAGVCPLVRTYMLHVNGKRCYCHGVRCGVNETLQEFYTRVEMSVYWLKCLVPHYVITSMIATHRDLDKNRLRLLLTHYIYRYILDDFGDEVRKMHTLKSPTYVNVVVLILIASYLFSYHDGIKLISDEFYTQLQWTTVEDVVRSCVLYANPKWCKRCNNVHYKTIPNMNHLSSSVCIVTELVLFYERNSGAQYSPVIDIKCILWCFSRYFYRSKWDTLIALLTAIRKARITITADCQQSLERFIYRLVKRAHTSLNCATFISIVNLIPQLQHYPHTCIYCSSKNCKVFKQFTSNKHEVLLHLS